MPLDRSAVDSRSRSPRRRVGAARVVAAVLVCAAALLASTVSAFAHSTLVEATPDQGETVTSLDEIVLRFGDPIVDDPTATVLALQTPDGVDIPIATPHLPDALTLRAAVPNPPEPGSYVLRYTVLSFDGDLNDGGHLFEFDPDAAANASAPFVLLAVGGLAMAAVIVLLRPRRGDADGPNAAPGAVAGNGDGAVV